MKRGPYRKATLVERLRRRTVERDGCWLWTGRVLPPFGYGQITSDGKTLLVHRVAYEQLVGPIPAGFNVLHRCDHPACWNPEHLFTGTHADNTADKVAKGRHVYGERHQWYGRKNSGDAHVSSKISEADVTDIRVLAGFGLSHTAIAREYGVTQSCISRRLSGARGGPNQCRF